MCSFKLMLNWSKYQRASSRFPVCPSHRASGCSQRFFPCYSCFCTRLGLDKPARKRRWRCGNRSGLRSHRGQECCRRSPWSWGLFLIRRRRSHQMVQSVLQRRRSRRRGFGLVTGTPTSKVRSQKEVCRIVNHTKLVSRISEARKVQKQFLFEDM